MLTTDFKAALAFMESGRTADALPILARIVERWPNYTAAQVAYAKALQLAGDPEASFAAWTRAESLVSRSDVVRSGLLKSAALLFGDPEIDDADVESVFGGRAQDIAPVVPVAEAETETREFEQSPIEEQSEEEAAAATTEDFVAAPESEFVPSHPDPEAVVSAVESEELEPSPAEDIVDEADSTDESLPEYTEERAMDPALFVPIAVPIDLPAASDTEEPEWVGEPSHEDDAEEMGDMPEWEGGYAGGPSNGAGTDAGVEPEHAPDEVELDRLIGELESARIIPAEDPSSIPAPDLSDDIDDVVSETLARIYMTQRQFSEAARVYDRLALENPDRAQEFEAKATEMRGRAQ